MVNDVDEVSAEEIVARADYYENLLNDTLPQTQAKRIALEQFNVDLEDNLLNLIMGQYACSSHPIEDCVRYQLKRHNLI